MGHPALSFRLVDLSGIESMTSPWHKNQRDGVEDGNEKARWDIPRFEDVPSPVSMFAQDESRNGGDRFIRLGFLPVAETEPAP